MVNPETTAVDKGFVNPVTLKETEAPDETAVVRATSLTVKI